MENNRISKSNKIKIIVITALIFLVSIAGISYAFFAIEASGNEEASSIIIVAADLKLTYTDTLSISGDGIYPGWYKTKTISVYNNGASPVSYNLIWRDLLNEIISDELVISGTCSSSPSGSCDNISETVVPTKTTEAHNIKIKKGISIEPGVTHTYTVTTTFKELGSNQNYNQNKSFRGTLNIEQYQGPFKRTGTDETTGLPVVRSVDHPTEEFYDISNAINYSSLDATFLTKINYDASKSILLARYNLYVGQNCTNAFSCTPISTSDSRYGLQSVDAKGYISSSSMIAVVPFSGSSNTYGYWDPSNSGINSDYGTYTNYANNIYDTNYVTAPNYSVAFYNNAGNANYSIAYYVEGYIETLGIEGTGRLLTKPEANAMTEAQRTNGQNYWLGTAIGNVVSYAKTDGNITYGNSFNSTSSNGVRPVIVVNTSDIQS